MQQLRRVRPVELLETMNVPFVFRPFVFRKAPHERMQERLMG
jgi:hypothetical protein